MAAAVGQTVEWREANRELCSVADISVREAGKVREEAAWLCDQTDLTTRRTQEDVKFRIKEKLTSTTRWRQDLQEELMMNTKQTESLKKTLLRLRRALSKSEEPLKVSGECQQYRKSRIGCDNVVDLVEEQLTKEVDCIREYQQRMKLLVELMTKQMEANRLVQKTLTSDIRNKVELTMRLCPDLNFSCRKYPSVSTPSASS